MDWVEYHTKSKKTQDSDLRLKLDDGLNNPSKNTNQTPA
jgi:hypothetical protein